MADIELLTIAEVSQLTRIPTSTLYQLVWKKRIPVVRLSRKMLRFRVLDIKAWIEQNSHGVHEPNMPMQKTVKKKRKNPKKDIIDCIVAKARENVVESET